MTDSTEIQNDTDCTDNHAFPSLELDHDKYRHHLVDLDITDEQANEFLEVLWNIMHTMVDIGMGLDTVQMFLPLNVDKAGSDSGKRLQQGKCNASFSEVSAKSGRD